jgi:TonB family protein
MDDKKIKLSLKVDVSDIETAETLGGGSAGVTARAYPLLKRTTSTQLYLNDGQTLAISGLIKQKTEEDLTKFPWLGDVPVLGIFFRNRSTKTGGGGGERGDTELVIMITPSLILDKKQVKETAKEEKEAVKENIPVKELPKKERAKKISKEKVIKEFEAVPEDTKVALAKLESPDLKKEALIAYVQEIAGYIADRIDYPWAARQGKIEGTLRLSLRISDAGEILDINISESSGSSVLDENALRIAKQISPYPSFPRGITEKYLWIQVPIVYNLKE